MKLGITVNPNKDTHSIIFSSGIGQNCVFLAMTLNQLASVKAGFIGDSPLGKQFGIPSFRLDECDVVIEVGLKLSDEEAEVVSKKGKLISYMAGNAMAMNLEAIASHLPYGEVPTFRYDQVWITPQHWKMNEDYCLLTRSDNVHQIPHVWDSLILRNSAATYGNTYAWKPSDKWKLSCFEANMNVLKTFHLPLLVMEQCERRNPTLIDHAFLFNTKHMVGQRHFDEFVNCLSIKSKLSVEDRMPLTDVLGIHCNAVVAHHWENELNYAWWDCLFGGFPLIHNAKPAAEVGYYYSDFDPEMGGKVLENALLAHADTFTEYKRKAHDFLWKLSPFNVDVQELHLKLLEAL